MDPVGTSKAVMLCSSQANTPIETASCSSSLCNRINRVVSFFMGIIKQGYESTIGRFFSLFWPSRNVKPEEVPIQTLQGSFEEKILDSFSPIGQSSLEAEVIGTGVDSHGSKVEENKPFYEEISGSFLLSAQDSSALEAVEEGLGSDMLEHINNGRALLENPEATFKQLEWWTEFCRPEELDASTEMQEICRGMFERMYPSMAPAPKSPEAPVVEPSPVKIVKDDGESDLSEMGALEKSLKEIARFKEGESFTVNSFNIWMKCLFKHKESSEKAAEAYDWLLSDGMDRLVSPYKGPASHVAALEEDSEAKENTSLGTNTTHKACMDKVRKTGVFIGHGFSVEPPVTP